MKTRVTIELTDDQRVAVGLMETGKMAPASRDEIISFVTEVVMATVNVAAQAVNDHRKIVTTEIREKLGMGLVEDE